MHIPFVFFEYVNPVGILNGFWCWPQIVWFLFAEIKFLEGGHKVGIDNSIRHKTSISPPGWISQRLISSHLRIACCIGDKTQPKILPKTLHKNFVKDYCCERGEVGWCSRCLASWKLYCCRLLGSKLDPSMEQLLAYFPWPYSLCFSSIYQYIWE